VVKLARGYPSPAPQGGCHWSPCRLPDSVRGGNAVGRRARGGLAHMPHSRLAGWREDSTRTLSLRVMPELRTVGNGRATARRYGGLPRARAFYMAVCGGREVWAGRYAVLCCANPRPHGNRCAYARLPPVTCHPVLDYLLLLFFAERQRPSALYARLRLDNHLAIELGRQPRR